MEHYIHWESLFPIHSKAILDLDFKAYTSIVYMFTVEKCWKPCVCSIPLSNSCKAAWVFGDGDSLKVGQQIEDEKNQV